MSQPLAATAWQRRRDHFDSYTNQWECCLDHGYDSLFSTMSSTERGYNLFDVEQQTHSQDDAESGEIEEATAASDDLIALEPYRDEPTAHVDGAVPLAGYMLPAPVVVFRMRNFLRRRAVKVWLGAALILFLICLALGAFLAHTEDISDEEVPALEDIASDVRLQVGFTVICS